MLQKTTLALCLGLVLLISGVGVAAASSLTPGQISSIASLLAAFGVNPATVAAVETDLNGASSATSSPVQPISPVGVASSSVFFSAMPLSGAAPLTVSFSARGVVSQSKYIIDYGDGSTSGPLSTVMPPCASSATSCTPAVEASHAYTSPGTYHAVVEGYIACMWSNPRCLIAALPLGTATITVSAASSAATSSTPVINAMNPVSGSAGTQVTLVGDNFSPTGNIVHFGPGAIGNLSAKPAVYSCPMIPAGASITSCGEGSETITFTVPSSLSPYCKPGTACPLYAILVQPGTYPVSVENAGGNASNSKTFTVTAR